MYRLLNLLLLTLLASCSPRSEEPQHSFGIYAEEDVLIAENSGGSKYFQPIFIFVESIRLNNDETRAETLLYQALDYLMDVDGRIYVNDEGNGRIAVFGADGEYERSFGRSGDGPGEFRQPQFLWLQDGQLAVFDRMLQRTTLFHTDGSLIGVYSWLSYSRSMSELHPLPDGKKVIINWISERPDIGEFRGGYTSVVISIEGDTLAEFNPPLQIRGRYVTSGTIRTDSPYYFGPLSQIYYHRDYGILCCSSDQPELRWYSLFGELKRIIRLGLPKEAVTYEERAAIYRTYDQRIADMSNERMKEVEKEVKRQAIIPEYKSYWQSALVDDAGFIWLRMHRDYTREDPGARISSFMIFSPEGEYLGDATWPARVGNISKGHLITGQLNPITQEDRYIVYQIRPAVKGLKYP